jgi:hypothetical protein
MLNDSQNQPLAEQGNSAPSVTNFNCYRESSKFFLLISQSSRNLASICLDASYPLRDLSHSRIDEERFNEYSYHELLRVIGDAEEEAQKLARQCAEIRRRLTGKEAQDV